MTLTVWTHLVYLAISVALTVWVARTLHRNGRIFLVDSFHGNEPLADSILQSPIIPRAPGAPQIHLFDGIDEVERIHHYSW